VNEHEVAIPDAPARSASRVHRLSPEIANQIAAGEVIERPANACKELIENAIDAGARRIVVEIEEGGKKLIRVRDDGCGMNAADAVLSLQRHATSKLQDIDDLYSIRTLGFRGEALPSIAAVSRLELTTREPHAEAGTRIEVEAGTVLDLTEVGCTEGTEIAIHNLFFNTPARFKFLKSDAAEAARTTEMVGHMALAYPNVGFRLRHNGTETLHVEGGGNPFNAVVSVLGRETARQMMPIAAPAEADESSIKVTGFVGRPQLTRSNRNLQILFVNGRAVRSRALQHAIAAAYEGLVHGHSRYPVTVIFVDVPTNSVDVNVHPTKSEVRFAREWEVHHALRLAVRDTLIAAQLAPEWRFQEGRPPLVAPQHAAGIDGLPAVPSIFDDTGAPPAPARSPFAGLEIPPPDYRGMHQPVAPHGGSLSQFHNAYHPAPRPDFTARYAPPGDQNRLPEVAPLGDSGALVLRPLAQIQNNAYILCEADDGLYIVCQHRAHERILADRAIAAAEGKPVESQRLVIPFTVEVGARASAAIEENNKLLKDLGFEVEAFGGDSVLVRSVPSLVANSDYEVAFTDLLDELVSGPNAGQPSNGIGHSLQERRRALLTMLACKNSIKAGDPLQAEQMKSLIDDLVQAPNPSICPHGQPILIKISTWELNKKFEREYASR